MSLSDYDTECTICRLDDCDMSNKRCGMVRGVKYGLYPAWILSNPTPGIDKRVVCKDPGFKEIPLFSQSDNMKKFCDKVARYEE